MRSEYWPAKLDLDTPRLPPPQPPSLTAEQQEEAITMLQQGMSLRSIAKNFSTSYESMRRLAQKEGISLQPSQPKLTPEEQQEALALLKQGVSLRQMAKRFGVNPESIRRLAKRLQRGPDEESETP